MNSILKFIALAMCVSVAFSATTGTFASTTSKVKASTTAVEYTNGWVVELSAAGWVIGDAITIPTGTAGSVTYTTLTKNTVANSGVTGVGLVGVSGCTPVVTSATTTLVNTGASVCPADFVTLYSAAAPTGSSQPASLDFTKAPLTQGSTVQWTLTVPAAAAATKTIGISIADPVGATPIVASTTTAAVGSAKDAQQYALSTITYAFYVETTNSDAVVCFQTATQYNANKGNCGTVITTSSAGILSATISGFVAMVALIFFN